MAGVSGCYSANQRRAVGIESVGTKPLPKKGRSISSRGALLAPSEFLAVSPIATASQVREKTNSVSRPRGAFGDQCAVVEHRDAVGEPAGFLQTLGGEKDRDSALCQVPDDLPNGAAAAHVQAGGGLIQEDDARVPDQRHGQIQPALQAAGLGGGGLVGVLDQIELLHKPRGAPLLAPLANGAG